MEFAKVLRAHCLIEHLQWLLPEVSGFQATALLKMKLRKRCFSVNFDRTPPDDCFLCLSVNFEKFFRTLPS